MTINESRLSNGTLTLGPTTPLLDMSCQITNVRITSAYDDDGDPITTLCGDSKPAGRKLSGRKLEGTFVQDFDDPDGVVKFLWDNDLSVVPFTFMPDETPLTITGSVMLEVPAETYGGDVKTRITSDFSWNIQDEPVFTYTAGVATEAEAEPVGASA